MICAQVQKVEATVAILQVNFCNVFSIGVSTGCIQSEKSMLFWSESMSLAEIMCVPNKRERGCAAAATAAAIY